jgi:hypothetical protein
MTSDQLRVHIADSQVKRILKRESMTTYVGEFAYGYGTTHDTIEINAKSYPFEFSNPTDDQVTSFRHLAGTVI